MKISPAFKPHFESLLKTREYDITIKETDSSIRNGQYHDRVTIGINYCKRELQWKIILNHDMPLIAPDFMLNDGFENIIKYQDIQSLKQWSAVQPESLWNIIKEMIGQFKTNQRNIITKSVTNERLKFEIETLDGIEGVQTFYDRNRGEVRCLIPLADFNIATLLGAKEPSKDGVVTLFVSFDAAEHPFKTPEITLDISNVWAELLTGMAKLPAWSSNTCLLDYIPSIKDVLKEHFENIKTRKQVIKEFTAGFGGVLEYDSVAYRKLSLMVDFNMYPVIVIVQLPSSYPRECPQLIMQSFQHTGSTGRPLQKVFNDYPYSPRWDAAELVKRLKAFIIENLPAFKKACSEA
jgi:BRCA1-A complex subunit BRE